MTWDGNIKSNAHISKYISLRHTRCPSCPRHPMMGAQGLKILKLGSFTSPLTSTRFMEGAWAWMSVTQCYINLYKLTTLVIHTRGPRHPSMQVPDCHLLKLGSFTRPLTSTRFMEGAWAWLSVTQCYINLYKLYTLVIHTRCPRHPMMGAQGLKILKI